LTQIFGTLSFGEIAVNAFFFISGYLITGSYLNSSTIGSYALKRILRIYPGFLVASLVCWFVVLPLGGGSLHLPAREWISAIARALLLREPNLGEAFKGSYYPALDRAMWTISYEFNCYTLLLALGLAGILARRNLVFAITVTLLVLSVMLSTDHDAAMRVPAAKELASTRFLGAINTVWIASIRQNIRLMGIFMTGASYFLFREKIRFKPLNFLVGSLALCGCMLNMHLASAGTAVFGGFLILAAARKATGGILERINNENDISYGTYLYAWPIIKLVFWWWPAFPVVWAGLVAFLSACLCGWLSWRFVEKPAMALLHRRRQLVRSVSA
jgi:peptidoglycan/LPS O-acetylase OafA/YrhL